MDVLELILIKKPLESQRDPEQKNQNAKPKKDLAEFFVHNE